MYECLHLLPSVCISDQVVYWWQTVRCWLVNFEYHKAIIAVIFDLDSKSHNLDMHMHGGTLLPNMSKRREKELATVSQISECERDHETQSNSELNDVSVAA